MSIGRYLYLINVLIMLIDNVLGMSIGHYLYSMTVLTMLIDNVLNQYKSKLGLNVRSSCRDKSKTCYFCPNTVTRSVYFVLVNANVVTFCVLHHLLKHVYVILYKKNMPRVRVRKIERGLVLARCLNLMIT